MANGADTERLVSTFITDVAKIHGTKYTILSEYTHSKVKVQVLCNICGSTWHITPNKLKLGRGCPKCASLQHGKAQRDKAAMTFIEDVKKVHGDTIRIISSYTTSKQKVVFVCLVCNSEHTMAASHIKAGHGCKTCAIKRASEALSNKVATEFTSRVHKTHGDSIQVLTEYTRSSAKVTFKCSKCNTSWDALPPDVVSGHGCPHCARTANLFSTRMTSTRPTWIYYVHFINLNLWKIGCTVHSVAQRFKSDIEEPEVIHQELFAFGGDAYRLESYLLKQFREYKYTGPKVLNGGNTELLVSNIPFAQALEVAKDDLGVTNGY